MKLQRNPWFGTAGRSKRWRDLTAAQRVMIAAACVAIWLVGTVGSALRDDGIDTVKWGASAVLILVALLLFRVARRR